MIFVVSILKLVRMGMLTGARIGMQVSMQVARIGMLNILLAHACIPWTTIVWAHQIWWREIENSRKVTVLLKAISLVLWISYFPTKIVLHDKNRTFSKGDFSAVGFLDLLKTLKTQRQKSLFLYKSDFTAFRSVFSEFESKMLEVSNIEEDRTDSNAQGSACYIPLLGYLASSITRISTNAGA